MELAEKRCIIFGADSGIGSALHSHFKRNGYVCLGSTRRIETSQDPNFFYFDAETVETHEEVLKPLFAKPVDLLIWSIGKHTNPERGSFLGFDYEEGKKSFAVNCLGFASVASWFLRCNSFSKETCLIVLGSLGGSTELRGSLDHHQPGGNAIYRASKCALHNLARNLAYDFEKDDSIGAWIVVLHPGYVSSNSNKDSNAEPLQSFVKKFSGFMQRVRPSDNGKFLNLDNEEIPW
jgi:short-subunit dehydrogenase